MGILDFWVILEILKIFDNFRGLLKKKKRYFDGYNVFWSCGKFYEFFFFFFILWVFQGYFEHFQGLRVFC